MREITRAIVHHSASSRMTTLEEIRRWHLKRRFRDIGYHYVIERSGEIRVGRSIQVPGAHAKGHNLDSIGICVVGDNLDPEEKWDGTQRDGLWRLIRALRLVWPELEILAHREVGETHCPGLTGYEVREICG